MSTSDVFNQARAWKGFPPLPSQIVFIKEGLELSCGCKVTMATEDGFEVYHGDQCQSPMYPELQGLMRVGFNGVGAAIVMGSSEDSPIGLTNPFTGLLPYERNAIRTGNFDPITEWPQWAYDEADRLRNLS